MGRKGNTANGENKKGVKETWRPRQGLQKEGWYENQLQLSVFAAHISMLVATLLMLSPKMQSGATVEELPVSPDIFKCNSTPQQTFLKNVFEPNHVVFITFTSFVKSCPRC